MGTIFNLQPSSCPGPPTAVPRTSTNNNQTSTNSNFKRQNTVDSATIKENTARLSQSAATPTRPSTAKTPSFSSGNSEGLRWEGSCEDQDSVKFIQDPQTPERPPPRVGSVESQNLTRCQTPLGAVRWGCRRTTGAARLIRVG